MVFAGVSVIESSVIDRETAGQPVDVTDVRPGVVRLVSPTIVSHEEVSIDGPVRRVGRKFGADTDGIIDAKLFAGV